MASLAPFATADEVEEELTFTDILISTLDAGADDYAHKLAQHENTKRTLELRLEALHGGSRPQSQADMDGSSDQGNTFWQTTMNGRPLSSNGNKRVTSGSSAPSFNANKRSFPGGLSLETDQHLFKRPTPDPSNAGTPTSSLDSFELIERPAVDPGSNADRARKRQIAAEAALRRRREAEEADKAYAHRLSQQQSRPPSAFASSSRPGIQTTIGHTGSFQRPPPPQVKPDPFLTAGSSDFASAGPSHSPFAQYADQTQSFGMPQQTPYIKPELGPSQQQLVQRSRPSTGVVDLTASDDEDEDIAEIAPNNFTPSRRPERTDVKDLYGMSSRQATPGTYPMPGAYPMPGGYPTPSMNSAQSVYNQRNAADERVRQQYGAMRGAQLAMQNAIGGVKYAASSVSGQLGELNSLINGSSSRPYDLDRDDLVYGSAAQRPLGFDPQDPYAGQDALYKHRFDTIASYDPAKTKEEINTLLENIRPDEEMPAHLRVQTPESMAIKLHKYQELGLTWLKNCEEGSNKGGILADDMGLGKTIQMLSLLVTRRSDDPRCKTTLVVAPVALMRQWKQEIQTKIKPGPRHALSVFTQHGPTKKKSFRELQVYDVVLTTYGSIAAEVKKLETFRLRQHNDADARPYPKEQCALLGEDAKWYRVILDEAQCIKNKTTQTSKGACQLQARYRFCMTGTPMMNNVDELFSLIHFLRIRPYSVWEKFRSDFSNPLRSGGEDLQGRTMRKLQGLCKAIMLRRTKKSTFEGEPILVLPERTTDIDNPELDAEEMKFYQALEQRTALQFNKYLKAGTVGKQYTAVLVLLLRLRQACCHPHLIRDFGVSAAADVTPDDLAKLAEELAPQVVARIKEKDGSFECPICMDAAINPAIFIPCGHDTCSDCFARLTDPATALAAGNENGGTQAKCPNCRGPIDSKRITDFDSFKKVHQRELLTEEELARLEPAESEAEEDDSETESDEDSDTEEEDDVDHRGNLKGFVVNDGVDADSETESEPEHAGAAGPMTANGSKPASRKSKKKSKGSKKSAKGKGKEAKKLKKATNLADLKRKAGRNAASRKKYIHKLRKDWVSSAKIDKTLEILKPIMEAKEGEKVLIFSQWTTLLDLLEVPIDREGWGYRRYDGSMNAAMRGDAVDDFRDTRKNVRIMLVSLKAGNAGLNLNMASQVIILDPFWNPYIEEQAIDRAHRIGQTRPVKVHRVLVKGTVEDRIIELQERKRKLISEALSEEAGQSIARLGVQELAYLFGVTGNPAQAVQYVPQHRR